VFLKSSLPCKTRKIMENKIKTKEIPEDPKIKISKHKNINNEEKI
jgi:hypothetical protein